MVSFESFLSIIRNLKDSACGPDGIPYSAWKHAPEQAIYMLYRLYCSLFGDDDLSDDFNFSWLVLLAKGEDLSDSSGVTRRADDTRPLSLANSDSKICEIALN